MNTQEALKQFYLERGAHNLTIEAYQSFAGKVCSHLGELIDMAEVSELDNNLVILNLKDLHELAVDNFDVESAHREIENYHKELPKEICVLLEQLAGDIDSGVIEPSQIKGRIENIQTISEVYYEYQSEDSNE